MDELRLNLVDLSYKLLERDFFYTKPLSHSKKKELVDFAIEIGKEQGTKSIDEGLCKTNPQKYIKKFCCVNHLNDKPIIPIYSEMDIKRKTINIYTNEIEQTICDFKEEISIDEEKLYNLFALHEFFHFLEFTRIGLVSSMKKVSMLSIFKWNFTRGLSSLSEIAAHAYVREIINIDPITYISCCKD